MATSTSNLGLQKPDYSDAADIAVLNGNSDKIDSSVNATDGAIAIVSNGNTHPAIPSGNYVYIRGHGSLSEGLYKNSTSGTIGVNAPLSSSNVSAISSGGMNEMKSITDTLNSNLSNNVFQEIAPTGTRCTVVSGGVAVVGNLAVINVKIHSAYSATNTPSMLSVNVRTPKCVTALSCVKSGTTQGSMSGAIACHIGTNKQVYVQSVENDAYYDISGVVVLA